MSWARFGVRPASQNREPGLLALAGALAYSVVASVDEIIPKLREAAAPLSQAALSGGNGAKLM